MGPKRLREFGHLSGRRVDPGSMGHKTRRLYLEILEP
jgi:hypothetical protein